MKHEATQPPLPSQIVAAPHFVPSGMSGCAQAPPVAQMFRVQAFPSLAQLSPWVVREQLWLSV